MNDVLMLLFLAVLAGGGACMIVSVRRMAASDSRRCRRCRQAACCFLFFCITMLPCCTRWMADLTEAVFLAKPMQTFQQTVFSKRNYQVQYMLIFFLVWNDILLFAAWGMLRVLELFADRGEVYVWREQDLKGRLLHLPWLLTDCCYQRTDSSYVLKAWAAVLGKWMRNLSGGLLFLAAAFVAAGSVSLFVKIDWLSQAKGASAAGGWYLLFSPLWLLCSSVGGFLEYCPKEKPDKIRKPVPAQSARPEISAALSAGKSIGLTDRIFSEEKFLAGDYVKFPAEEAWLSDFLTECYLRRCRVAVACREENQARAWKEALERMLGSRFDGVCVPRVGDTVLLQNEQDADIVVATEDELLDLEPERAYAFWFSQTNVMIAADCHRLLASSGRQTDAFFAVWNRKRNPMQYIFLGCSGNMQESLALTYYAASRVTVFGECCSERKDLVCWKLESPRGRMKRMLLAMQHEDGVTESWIKKRRNEFGMAGLGTEAFLSRAVSVVFPSCRLLNLYDSFLFWEEQNGLAAEWRVRLTDAGMLCMLRGNRNDLTDESAAIEGDREQRFVSECFCLQDKTPLCAEMESQKKRLSLYQAAAVRKQHGILLYPLENGMPDYEKETWLQEKETGEKQELTMLRMSLETKEGGVRTDTLSALLALVCDRVLEELFPYQKEFVRAACLEDSDDPKEKSLVCRLEPDEKQEPDGLVTVYILETDEWERGITAALWQETGSLIAACRAWLMKAKEPGAQEAGMQEAGGQEANPQRALLALAAAQLGEEPKEDWAGRLLRLLE